MTLKEFAGKYRLNVKRDGCGDQIIVGRKQVKDLPNRPEYHSHIYHPFGTLRFGVCLFLPTKRRWTYTKKQLVAVGFGTQYDADTEGTLLFDPADSKQAKLAIRVVGAKVRRVASAKQLENLKLARERSRIGRPSAP